MHKSSLIHKLFLIMILTYGLDLFSYQVTVHNNSNQTIRAALHTTQNYPCGHWYAGYVDKWCNCGNTITIGAKGSSTYNYRSTNKVCVAPCTSSIVIYDSNGNRVADQSKLVGGLTACSNIEVWTGQGSDGVWYMYTSDWTNNFNSWLNNQIVPALEQIITAGFNVNDLIPKAEAAGSAAGKIGSKINNLTSNINSSVNFGKNIASQIESITNQITNFLSRSQISLSELQSNYKDLVSGNYLPVIVKFLGQFEKLGIPITDATTLLTNIKTTNDNIISQINNLNLNPLILSVKGLLDVIQNLVGSLAGIVNDIPPTILSHEVVSPMQNIQKDLALISINLNALLNAPAYNASQIESNLMNGIFANINNVPNIINKISPLTNSIANDVNKLGLTIIPSLQNNIKPVTNLISTIKNRLISELEKPENIALMTPVIMTALPGAIFSLASFGTALPLVIPAVSLAAQPLIKSIAVDLLKQVNIDTLVSNIKDLVITLVDIANQAINAITIFKNEMEVNLLTDQSYAIVNNLVKLLDQTGIDITNLNNSIPSLIS